LSDEQRRRWSTLAGDGTAALRSRDFEAAVDRLAEAAALDPRHADLQYALGRALFALDRHAEAREAFERARDEDVCPLRALGPMAGIVREVAVDRAVPVVDFEQLADRWAQHGIPGAELFLDHVHPTIDGNRRLALAVLDVLEDMGVVTPGPDWGEAAVRRVTERVESGIDDGVHAVALSNLSKVIGWAGKLPEAYRLARQAVELDPDSVRVQYQAGLTADLVGRHDEAMAHYLRAIEIEPDAALPHGNLAVGLERQGRLEEAVVHYRIAFANSAPEDLDHHRRNLADALVKLGFLVYGQGRTGESVELLAEADRLIPGNPEILSRLGTALMAAGRSGEAVDRLRAVARMRPSTASDHNRLALALALDGQLDEAANAYRKALSLDPAVANAADGAFVVLQRMGRSELAAELRERVKSE
jgi:tetratricopeptide (TPR) repeat protein